jgi:hypothetical protein
LPFRNTYIEFEEAGSCKARAGAPCRNGGPREITGVGPPVGEPACKDAVDDIDDAIEDDDTW